MFAQIEKYLFLYEMTLVLANREETQQMNADEGINQGEGYRKYSAISNVSKLQEGSARRLRGKSRNSLYTLIRALPPHY